VRKSEGKSPLERHRHKKGKNIILHLTKIAWFYGLAAVF
jgi:hypothetical protein